MVGDNPILKAKIIKEIHDGPSEGHSGRDATRKRISSFCYWKGQIRDIDQYIRECDICQHYKYDNDAYPGLLQPLPIPQRVWHIISIEFIESLPKSEGKEIILVVVDRLSKYAHFLALSHPYSATTVAKPFMEQVYKLHGMSADIVSDRGSVFLNAFWQELMKRMKIQLKLSTTYHPQIDGQTEVVNRSVECYLRCMTGDFPKQ